MHCASAELGMIRPRLAGWASTARRVRGLPAALWKRRSQAAEQADAPPEVPLPAPAYAIIRGRHTENIHPRSFVHTEDSALY